MGYLIELLLRRRHSALLIDGDNISPAAIPSIMDEICREGRPQITQVFISRMHTSWQVTAEENGLELVIVPMVVTGKNSVDVALAIEAMRYALEASVREIVLVSSDSDFAYLAHQLRALGKVVHGIGADHTPLAFRTACSRFTVLSLVWTKSKARVPKGERFRLIRQVKRRVIQCLPNLAGKDGWTSVQQLEEYLRERDARFDPRALGHRTLDQFLRTMKEVERHPTRLFIRLRIDSAKATEHPPTTS